MVLNNLYLIYKYIINAVVFNPEVLKSGVADAGHMDYKEITKFPTNYWLLNQSKRKQLLDMTEILMPAVIFLWY